MGKKKVQTDGTVKEKRERKNINLDVLREYIDGKNNAHSIMAEMKIAQIGSLRNAVFMLSQIDGKFYTVPGLIDETRFKPVIKVGKSGIRLPLEKIPFAKGTTVSYDVQRSENSDIVIVITGPGSYTVKQKEASAE